MSIRISLDLMEIKIGDGSRWLISIFDNPKDFYLQFESRGDLREWFDDHCDNDILACNEHLIAFPTNPASSETMQKRLWSRFGSNCKIERVTDLSNISQEGRRWGGNPLAFAKAKSRKSDQN